MTPTWRKPAGVFAILLLIALWAGFIASFAGFIERLPVPAEALIYLFTGIAWIAPLKPLLRWMETGRWRGRAPDAVD